MVKKAVKINVSELLLRELLHLDDKYKIVSIQSEPMTDYFTFYITGDNLPEVKEGNSPESADIICTTKVVKYIEKVEIKCY